MVLQQSSVNNGLYPAHLPFCKANVEEGLLYSHSTRATLIWELGLMEEKKDK